MFCSIFFQEANSSTEMLHRYKKKKKRKKRKPSCYGECAAFFCLLTWKKDLTHTDHTTLKLQDLPNQNSHLCSGHQCYGYIILKWSTSLEWCIEMLMVSPDKVSKMKMWIFSFKRKRGGECQGCPSLTMEWTPLLKKLIIALSEHEHFDYS